MLAESDRDRTRRRRRWRRADWRGRGPGLVQLGKNTHRHKRRRLSFRRKLPPPAIQKARYDARATRDLGHHGVWLVHRRDKPSLLRRAPAPATLDRRDDLDTIHRHVANLVLATAPTQLSAVHKAAPLGGVL